MKIKLRDIPALQQEIVYKIGENSKDNFVIIDNSLPTDLWFHIEGCSSCHVIASIPQDIKLDKKQLRQIIKQGALVCKENSKYKSNKNVEIVYSYICNITKTHIEGQVTVLQPKNIIM
jgi:hypothetical protein|tara:strand:+ start:1657 stop:2010 length:354 start_codon:yes stop_codon:yes gene_type:complete